jgi:shikimate kinase
MSATNQIILIGYRGSGKSSVGKLLAQQLKWAWCDSDDEIEAGIDVSIADVFAQQGESHFRDLETAAIERLMDASDADGQVISLGGGAPMQPRNRELWKDRATCVYLKGSARTLYQRISSDESSENRRPDLTDEGGLAEVQKMLDLRSATYQLCADLIVDVDDRTPTEIVDQIEKYYSALKSTLQK